MDTVLLALEYSLRGYLFFYFSIVLIVWFLYVRKVKLQVNISQKKSINRYQISLALFIILFWILPFLAVKFFTYAQYNNKGFSSPEFIYFALTYQVINILALLFIFWLLSQTILSLRSSVSAKLFFPRRFIVIILWLSIIIGTSFAYVLVSKHERSLEESRQKVILQETPGTSENLQKQQEQNDYIKEQAIGKAKSYEYPILLPVATKSLYIDHWNNFIFESAQSPNVYVLQVGIPTSRSNFFDANLGTCDVSALEFGRESLGNFECQYLGSKGLVNLYERKGFNPRYQYVKEKVTSTVGKYNNVGIVFCASSGYCDYRIEKEAINPSTIENITRELKVGSKEELISIINSSKFMGKSE